MRFGGHGDLGLSGVRAGNAGCAPAAGRVAAGTSVRLKSGDLVGAARNADLWDFCGARLTRTAMR